ncbi:hypothetical protein FS837_008091 [Tulasnella sp. UAMH 9824]|nr:hypothetical protein FS837_008091 [Tulasnella sp. UAMH 9824]
MSVSIARLSSRRPISTREARVLDGLRIEWHDACFEGAIRHILQGNLDMPSIKARDPLLMYEAAGREDTDVRIAKVVSIFQADEQSLDELHLDGKPSSFGRANELIKDEAYRLARELPSDRFGLNFDPVAAETVEARIYKLNSYATGGHFKSHQDTPKGDGHIGTLLIGLPTSYTGGQLVLRPYGREINVDWSTNGRGALCKTALPWVFFYSSIEREVMPVTSGHRVTIAYDIYKSEASQRFIPSQLQANLDASSRPIFQFLQSQILGSRNFRPNGGRLAFPAQHQYPMPLIRRSVHLMDMLKGSDHILVHAARQFGIPVWTKAVYKNVDHLTGYSEDPPIDPQWTVPDVPDSMFKFGVMPGAEPTKRYPTDKYSSYDPDTGKNRFTSSTFGEDLPESICVEGSRAKYQMILEHRDLELEMDLIWVDEPDWFTKTSMFASYGNEPSSDHIYVSAVIILEIPPFGTGCRSESETSN